MAPFPAPGDAVNRLAGQTALVTAAGQGIGRAIAEGFVREGATVIATDVRPEPLTGLPCRHEALNVLDQAAVRALVCSPPELSVLVNATGFVHSGTVLGCDDAAWDFIALNVRSMFWTVQAALPNMLGQGGGSIVHITAVASSIKGGPNRFVYGTTKAAVIGLTRAVAADFVSRGIRCNAICPGTVESPPLRGRMAAVGDYEASRASVLTHLCPPLSTPHTTCTPPKRPGPGMRVSRWATPCWGRWCGATG